MAGVSVATASRVFSRQGYVSAEARAKVTGAADRLHYRPNGIARALRNSRSNIVGLVVPDILNELYKYTSAVLQRVLEEKGFGLILGVTNNNPETEQSVLVKLAEQRVDGIALVPSGSAEQLRTAMMNLPVVELHRTSGAEWVDTVLCDEFEGSFQLAQHLVELGHRRIVAVVGQKRFSTTRDRVAGVEAAWEERGGDPQVGYCRTIYGAYTADWGRDGLRSMLNAEDPPTAVISGSSLITLGCLQAIKACGRSCPEDISLVSCGNSDWFEVMTPEITAFQLPSREMGELAAQMLITRISAKSPLEPRVARARGHVQLGKSTRAVPPARQLPRSADAAGTLTLRDAAQV